MSFPEADVCRPNIMNIGKAIFIGLVDAHSLFTDKVYLIVNFREKRLGSCRGALSGTAGVSHHGADARGLWGSLTMPA
jgi:hypothetical protein